MGRRLAGSVVLTKTRTRRPALVYTSTRVQRIAALGELLISTRRVTWMIIGACKQGGAIDMGVRTSAVPVALLYCSTALARECNGSWGVIVITGVVAWPASDHRATLVRFS